MSFTSPILMAVAIVFAGGILWAIYSIEERYLRQQTKQRHPSARKRGGDA